MFPRISKFSNLSTTSGNTQSTASQSNVSSQAAAGGGKRNDSSNIRNLLFGGYEESPV